MKKISFVLLSVFLLGLLFIGILHPLPIKSILIKTTENLPGKVFILQKKTNQDNEAPHQSHSDKKSFHSKALEVPEDTQASKVENARGGNLKTREDHKNSKSHPFTSKKPLKLACREIPEQDLKNNTSLPTSDHRVTKLNQLMDVGLDWVLTDLNDEIIDLYCLRESKIIVINFWATWCAPCIRELPSLSKLAQNKELFVLAVSTENPSVVKKFLERAFKSGLSPQLKVAIVKEQEKLKHFPQDKIPATYIFDKKGLLKIKHMGEKDWSEPNTLKQILLLDK